MATIRDVVALVVGEHPEPQWLEGRLAQMARTIRSYVAGEETAPFRAEVRARLDAFREAAARLREDLSDPRFVTYIGNDWSSLPLAHREVMDTLETLGNRASQLSMKYSGRAGAERAFPVDRDDAVTSHELCAWTIMQAMMRCRGRTTIAADNVEAWQAANALYQHCGGLHYRGKKLPSGERGEPSGWRDHIIAVQHIQREGSLRGNGLASMGEMFEAISLVPLENDD